MTKIAEVAKKSMDLDEQQGEEIQVEVLENDDDSVESWDASLFLHRNAYESRLKRQLEELNKL